MDLERRRERLLDGASDLPSRGDADRAPVPGKATLTEGLLLLRMAREWRGLAVDAEERVARAAQSGGQPLPGELRSKFETSLGADLGGVRVHTGSDSAVAARSVSARAYTVGQDIHFGAGEYSPGTREGQLLLAHEVAHTVQQAGVARRAQFKLEVSQPGDAHEREADAAASAMVAGAPAVVSGAGGLARSVIQRQEQAPPDADDPQHAQKAEMQQLQKALNEASTVIEEATRELAKIRLEQKKDRKKQEPSKKVGEIKKKVVAIRKRAHPACEKLKGMAEQEGKADPAVARFERAVKAWEAVAKARAPRAKAGSAEDSANPEASTNHVGGESSGGPEVPDIVSNATG